MPKGQKLCTKCKGVLGPRSKVCKYCGEILLPDLKYSTKEDLVGCRELVKLYQEDKPLPEIIPTKVSVESKIKPAINYDWHKLEKGDVIKIASDSGPVWTLESGQEVNMGHHGYFSVISHDLNGIHCRGTGKKNSGYHYIFMGDEEYCETTGILRRPHTIINVRKNVIDDN